MNNITKRTLLTALLMAGGVAGCYGMEQFSKEHFSFDAMVKAAAKGELDKVQRMYNLGENIEMPDERGCRPLQAAAYHGHINVMKFLISKGANVNAKGEGNMTPLHSAIVENQHKAVKFLLANKKVDINVKGGKESEFTPFHLAAQYDSVELMKLLISKGVSDIDMKDKLGSTPLHHAATFHSFKAVKFLVNKGANIFLKNKVNMTPFECAAALFRTSFKTAQFLLFEMENKKAVPLEAVPLEEEEEGETDEDENTSKN